MNGRETLLLAGRALGAYIFLGSGFTKLTTPIATKAYFVSVGIPYPDIAYWIAVATELLGSIGLLLGFQTEAAAFLLMAYCVATAVMVQMDFSDLGKYQHFRKNLAMAGGYLAFMAVGAGAYSVDAFLARRKRQSNIAAG